MDIEWVPRLQNQTADLISNIVDYDDWEVTTEFFSKINSKWGPFTVDRFANVKNHKVKKDFEIYGIICLRCKSKKIKKCYLDQNGTYLLPFIPFFP